MLKLLFLAILLTGCGDHYSPNAIRSTLAVKRMQQTLTPTNVQKIAEPSLVLGIISVGALPTARCAYALFSLKRQ